MNNCIENCPLCAGCGWWVPDHYDHGTECTCETCQILATNFRALMEPCPNKDSIVIDPTDPREVAYAERFGFTLRGQA